MNAFPRLLAGPFLVLLLATTSLRGGDKLPAPLDPPSPYTPVPANVVTSITLTIAITESFAPQPPVYPVSVIPGTRVVFNVGWDPADLRSVKWFKDGTSLGVSSNTLQLSPASASDTGRYSASITLNDGSNLPMQPVTLSVEAPSRQRLLNCSTRGTLNAGQHFFISGFVVAPSPGKSTEGKLLLIRAVGPTLSSYGIADPLAAPELHVYDGSGGEVAPFSALADVYPKLLLTRVAKAGAFPLPDGTKDVANLYNLPSGVYSAKVSSADGGNGTALLEIYEVPE